MTYQPGFVPASQLAHLYGQPRIDTMVALKPTALMWERWYREAIRTKHSIGIAQPGGAYRSYANLVDIQRQWLGKSHDRNWFLNPGSGAMPSLTSVHGLGRALDLNGSVAWAKQTSEEYGVTWPLVYLGDTNHGQHDGTTRGASGIYPYEIKRLGRYLQDRTSIKIGAVNSGSMGGPLHRDHVWVALRQVVKEDKREGMSLRSHYSHYLDIEAKQKAAA